MKKIVFIFLYILSICSIYAYKYSGTLPVLFINTENNQPITSKDEYLNATFYIDRMNSYEFENVGSIDNQLPLLIRGRGNFTWESFEKKPYKIKFNNKTSLLGMKKNKHFALLAHADDRRGFLKNSVSFEISKLLELDYTPAYQPVEVVLNNEYIGLYFLTETVRVSKNRVNITEQSNFSTDNIEGGWLVELDNYRNSNQIVLPLSGTNLDFFQVTYHSPDSLSVEQENYLFNQFIRIKDGIYTDDKSSREWEEFIDMESLAKFYIIAEVTDHLEAFLGSCFLYKDTDTKWKFGPVWDFGHAFNDWHEKNMFIYEGSTYFPHCIIEEIAKFPHFQECVKKIWKDFYPNKYNQLDTFIDSFTKKISSAALCDYERWPEYGNKDEENRKLFVKKIMNEKVEWLNTQWGEGIYNDISNNAFNDNIRKTVIYNLNGNISNGHKHGIYILISTDINGNIIRRKVVQ